MRNVYFIKIHTPYACNSSIPIINQLIQTSFLISKNIFSVKKCKNRFYSLIIIKKSDWNRNISIILIYSCKKVIEKKQIIFFLKIRNLILGIFQKLFFITYFPTFLFSNINHLKIPYHEKKISTSSAQQPSFLSLCKPGMRVN